MQQVSYEIMMKLTIRTADSADRPTLEQVRAIVADRCRDERTDVHVKAVHLESIRGVHTYE